MHTLMIPVCDLAISRLYLLRDQSFTGRCVVALDVHKQELCELSLEEQTLFIGDLSWVSALQRDLFQADKVNYAIFGDKVPHLHVHIAAKRQIDRDFGTPYNLCMRTPIWPGEEELEDTARRMRDYLGIGVDKPV